MHTDRHISRSEEYAPLPCVETDVKCTLHCEMDLILAHTSVGRTLGSPLAIGFILEGIHGGTSSQPPPLPRTTLGKCEQFKDLIPQLAAG